jgi:predicted dehydrogenase
MNKTRIRPSMNRRAFIISSMATFPAAASLLGQASSDKPKIRIGQIGTRHAHASGKIKAIRDQSDVYELVGVVEADSRRRRELSKTNAYRGVNWMTEQELLGTKGLQAVAVETEVSELVETGIRCVQAGKHIHLDKPGGDTLPLFRELLEKAEASERIVQMGYMLRYNRAFQFMYHAVQDGWLGRIMEIDCMMGKLANEDTRKAIGRYPGGGMFELAGHVIDSIIHMLGKPRSVTPFTHRTQSDGIADNQLAVLDFESATATVRINHRDPFGSPRRRFQIAGDKGAVEIQQMESGDVTLYLDEPRGAYKKGVQKIALGKDGRYDGEFADLARVLRGEKTFDWSYRHDLDVQEALLLASGMPTV